VVAGAAAAMAAADLKLTGLSDRDAFWLDDDMCAAWGTCRWIGGTSRRPSTCHSAHVSDSSEMLSQYHTIYRQLTTAYFWMKKSSTG